MQALRQQEAVPILNDWKQWLEKQRGQVVQKSSIGKAVNYTLNLWSRLAHYTEQETYHIDNNPIENTIRPLAIGRKNYLFAGSHDAAQRAAMFYSFFATCKFHDVNPYNWLKDVLPWISETKLIELHKLTPHNWADNPKH
ncbi:MAG: IS66 family transposase [Cytophagales bacterium]|nr:IS66 family transposase [Cytophagales bacterium]